MTSFLSQLLTHRIARETLLVHRDHLLRLAVDGDNHDGNAQCDQPCNLTLAIGALSIKGVASKSVTSVQIPGRAGAAP